jgi:hypothetical protein
VYQGNGISGMWQVGATEGKRKPKNVRKKNKAAHFKPMKKINEKDRKKRKKTVEKATTATTNNQQQQ